MIGAAGVLAHQGGWDELLVALAPVAVFVVLLRLGIRRARAAEAAARQTGTTGTTGTTRPPTTER